MIATLFIRIFPLVFYILMLHPSPKTYAQINTTFSRPGYSMNFNHNGTNWIHNSNSVYTYNSNGQLLLKLTTALSTNQPLLKNEVSYDQQGREKSNLYFSWSNNNWQLNFGQRDSMIYALNNRIVQQISSSFNYGKWESEKFDNTYDANGNLTQQLIFYLNNGTWELRHRTMFTYVNGTKTEELFQVLNGTVWQNKDKYVYAGWHSQIAQPTSYTLHSFNTTTNQWSSYGRNTITLTANGGYITLRENLQGGIWVTDWRITENRDFRGNYGGYTTEDYKNGAWVLTGGMEINLTYNNNFDITERVYRYQSISQPFGPIVDQSKEVYSNFQYFGPHLGLSELENSEPEVIVSPNPATDIIHIEFTEQKPQALTATISDISGKIWLSKVFKFEGSKQLNVEALPKGLYLLHLETAQGKTVKKIVKN